MAKKQQKQDDSNKGTSTSLAVLPPANLPAGITVKRHVTLPSLAIKEKGQAEILTIMDPLRVSKIKQKDKESNREPATICTIGRHVGEHNPKATQGMFTFIVPTVVKGNLERDYVDEKTGEIHYVGKSFFIRNLGKRTESQRYNDFEIFEVDVPSAK